MPKSTAGMDPRKAKHCAALSIYRGWMLKYLHRNTLFTPLRKQGIQYFLAQRLSTVSLRKFWGINDQRISKGSPYLSITTLNNRHRNKISTFQYTHNLASTIWSHKILLTAVLYSQENTMDAEAKTRKRPSQDDGGAKKKRKKVRQDEGDLDAEAGLNLAFARMDGQLIADHIAQKTTRFGTELSSIELSDLYISGKKSLASPMLWQERD